MSTPAEFAQQSSSSASHDRQRRRDIIAQYVTSADRHDVPLVVLLHAADAAFAVVDAWDAMDASAPRTAPQ